MLLSTNVGFGLNLHNHSNKRDGRTERVSHTFDYVIILDQSGVARNASSFRREAPYHSSTPLSEMTDNDGNVGKRRRHGWIKCSCFAC